MRQCLARTRTDRAGGRVQISDDDFRVLHPRFVMSSEVETSLTVRLQKIRDSSTALGMTKSVRPDKSELWRRLCRTSYFKTDTGAARPDA